MPWKYLRALRSREAILEFCEPIVEPGVNILDVGHNIGEAVQSSTPGLRRLLDHLDRPIEETFTSTCRPPRSPGSRSALRSLGGLLRFPITPGKTIVILKVAKAAAATGDLHYTFGTGKPERSCVFMGFFLDFTRDLQAELNQRGAAAPPPHVRDATPRVLEHRGDAWERRLKLRGLSCVSFVLVRAVIACVALIPARRARSTNSAELMSCTCSWRVGPDTHTVHAGGEVTVEAPASSNTSSRPEGARTIQPGASNLLHGTL